MGTTLSNLQPPAGAKRRPRRRVGRGDSSGDGTTAGRGQKGQLSRAGVHLHPGFEGGQMPLQRRLPKRGFKSLFRVSYHAVNVQDLGKCFQAGDVVDSETLKARGMMPRRAKRIKVLANGELSVALTVRAHAFSKTAVEKIAKAGGTTEVVEIKPARKED